MPRHGLGNRGFQRPIGPPAERRDRLAAVDLEVARFQNAAIFKLPPTGAGTPMESKRVRNLGHGRDRPFHRAEIPCPRNSSMVVQCAWRLFNPPKRPTAHLGPKPFRFGSPSASAERSQRKGCNAPVTFRTVLASLQVLRLVSCGRADFGLPTYSNPSLVSGRAFNGSLNAVHVRLRRALGGGSLTAGAQPAISPALRSTYSGCASPLPSRVSGP